MINKIKLNKAGFAVIAIVVLTSLAGCSTIRNLGGNAKNAPDEFKVVNKPPLSMPPDYSLRPPRSGVPQPQNLTASQNTINALFPGRTVLPPPASKGEQALINAIGAAGQSANIRSFVGDDKTIVVEKGSLLDDVLTMSERSDGSDGSHLTRTSSKKVKEKNN